MKAWKVFLAGFLVGAAVVLLIFSPARYRILMDRGLVIRLDSWTGKTWATGDIGSWGKVLEGDPFSRFDPSKPYELIR